MKSIDWELDTLKAMSGFVSTLAILLQHAMPLELFSDVFPNVLFSRDKNIGNGHCPASLTVARH